MILTSYPVEVKLVNRFLQLLNVPVTPGSVNESMQNHPDWPSLLCISDSLTKWKVANAAAKIEVASMNELSVPFLAITKDRQFPLAIVTRVTEDTVERIYGNSSKPQVASKEEFIKQWDGICLVAEPQDESGETDYQQKKWKQWFSAILPVAFLAGSVIIGFWLLNKNASSLNENAVSGIYVQFVLMLCGLLVSGLLLWYEIDKRNPFLQKVCTGIAKTNCNAILSGKGAKVFSWLSWSEIGFFYFAGGVLATIFFPGNGATSLLVMLASPYILFSVYYQWRVAKQWCLLCLFVQLILLLSIGNLLLSKMPLNMGDLTAIPQVAVISFLYILPAIGWFMVKPFLLKMQEVKNTKRSFARLKYNPQVFNSLLKEQKPVTISADGLGITLGNPNAKHELIKVCNPYCGPCAKAHPEIEKIVEASDNIRVRIIFSVTKNENDQNSKVAQHLLAIAESNDMGKTKKALDEWYLAKRKDYEAFATSWPVNFEKVRDKKELERMADWCEKMEIRFTPTIFINGYQLPNTYNIQDIEYFLLE